MRINLLEETWEREVPHDQFAYLRRNAPVHWHDVPDDTGFWAVTKYTDIKAISRDVQTWSTEIGTAFIRTQTPEFIEIASMMLLNMDPPKHTRYRRLVSAGLHARTIARLIEAPSNGAPRRSSEGVRERDGEVEFVTDVAAYLPLQMICDLIGVPEEDRHLIFEWRTAWSASRIPTSARRRRTARSPGPRSTPTATAIVDDRRAQPA